MNKILAKEAIKSFLIEDIGTGDLSTDLVFDTELRASVILLLKMTVLFVVQKL